jgi:hypothetical protein
VESGRLLRRIHAAGVFPSDRDELLRVSHAVRDATEFVEIGDALPPEALHPLAADLQRAVGGSLGRGGTSAVQYQTQLWVGAVLAHSGAQVGVILNALGSRPDFVVEKGTMKYPVEVKRPRTFRAERIISEANGQIVASRCHGGAIVVDLTDCIDQNSAVTVGDDAHPNDTSLKLEAERLTKKLSERIYDDKAKQPRLNRDHIFGLVTTGRTIHWNTNDRTRIYLFRFLMSVVFGHGCYGNLRSHRSRWLTKLIQDGVTSAGSIEIRSTRIDL